MSKAEVLTICHFREVEVAVWVRKYIVVFHMSDNVTSSKYLVIGSLLSYNLFTASKADWLPYLYTCKGHSDI